MAGLIEQSESQKWKVKTNQNRLFDNRSRTCEIRSANRTRNPSSWEDENFEVHVAFFSPTSKKNRIRILEGRLNRLQERADILRADLERSAVGLDKYLVEWRRHSLETAEREIAWLEEMIKSERKN